MYSSLILCFPLRLHLCDLHQTITNNFISSPLPGSPYTMLPHDPAPWHSSQLLRNWSCFQVPRCAIWPTPFLSPGTQSLADPTTTHACYLLLSEGIDGVVFPDLCGDCLLCNIYTAFLLGLGEPRSWFLETAVKLQLGYPIASPGFPPFALEIRKKLY